MIFFCRKKLPSLDTYNPTKLTFYEKHWHLFSFHVRLYFIAITKAHLVMINALSTVNTNREQSFMIIVDPLIEFGSIPCCSCSNINKSWKYCIITREKTGKFQSPKSITSHTYLRTSRSKKDVLGIESGDNLVSW